MKHSELSLFKEQGQKITCLTAYDASMAKILDQSGIDAILIGDSLGMVIQGEENTRSVSISDMIYHTSIVSGSSNNALIIADMPFSSYDNPDDALENAKSFKYDLVITDIEMPRMDGFTLTERLRGEEGYTETPVILVSSRDTEEDKMRGMQAGADAYIIKGTFDQTNLVEAIQRLVG